MADVSFLGSCLYNVSYVTLTLVFIATFIIAYSLTRRPHNVPPGPPCWPVIGNLPSLIDVDLFKKLANLRKRYGDVCGVYIGSQLWVFLNGYDVIHDALLKKGRLFSARPTDQYVKRIGFSGIIMENGTTWKERKSFLLFALGKLCFSDNGKYIEGIIHREIEHFIQDVRKTRNLITDPRHLISHSFTNIIINVMYGLNLGHDHEDLRMLVSSVEKAVKKFAVFKILSSVIPIEWIPWERFGVVDLELRNTLRRFHFRLTSNGVENYKEGHETSILHHYLKVLQSEEVNGKPISDGSFSMEAFNDFAQDLTVAGSETSATATKWILLYLALNIDLQRKLQAEIDDKIPRERLPSLSDRACLTTVEATILEGLRIGIVTPLSTPRTVTEDIIFRGYLITKETTVIANLSSIFMDPDIFPEPEVFKPERFLNETGSQVRVPKEMIPFAFGPRSCPGETLVRFEVFLFISAILQHFELRLPDGSKKPSLKGVLAETYKPQPFQIEFVTRNK